MIHIALEEEQVDEIIRFHFYVEILRRRGWSQIQCLTCRNLAPLLDVLPPHWNPEDACDRDLPLRGALFVDVNEDGDVSKRWYCDGCLVARTMTNGLDA